MQARVTRSGQRHPPIVPVVSTDPPSFTPGMNIYKYIQSHITDYTIKLAISQLYLGISVFCYVQSILGPLSLTIFQMNQNTDTVYCLLFKMKKFRCCMSLPSFQEKRSWLPAYISFHSIHVQKFAKSFRNFEAILKNTKVFTANT